MTIKWERDGAGCFRHANAIIEPHGGRGEWRICLMKLYGANIFIGPFDKLKDAKEFASFIYRNARRESLENATS